MPDEDASSTATPTHIRELRMSPIFKVDISNLDATIEVWGLLFFGLCNHYGDPTQSHTQGSDS